MGLPGRFRGEEKEMNKNCWGMFGILDNLVVISTIKRVWGRFIGSEEFGGWVSLGAEIPKEAQQPHPGGGGGGLFLGGFRKKRGIG